MTFDGHQTHVYASKADGSMHLITIELLSVFFLSTRKQQYATKDSWRWHRVSRMSSQRHVSRDWARVACVSWRFYVSVIYGANMCRPKWQRNARRRASSTHVSSRIEGTNHLSGTIQGGPLLISMLGITAVSVVTVTEADVIMTGVLYAAIFVGGDQSTVQLSNCR